MSKSVGYIYEFGEFRLDLVKRELRRACEIISMTPKVFDTLRVLVLSQGKVVTKDVLMEEIWADSFVEESGLMRNISVLRKALGEQTNSIPFIVTVPGQGYRFLADVREISGEDILIVHEQTRARIVIEEKDSANGFHSLAVLPFKTIGNKEENGYLGLGMADSLITKLSNIKQLRVRPTSAVIKYSGLEQDPIEAGRDLRVESIIEGSIWQISEQLRVTVQLVNIKSQAALWADKFDESFTDIFAIQDSISERVASALEFKLTIDERKRLTKRETENLTAYQLYLRAFYQLNRLSAENTAQAVVNLEKAIATDPNYAPPYTALFSCMVLIGIFHTMPALVIADKARGLAAKALELDETLPAAHYSQGLSSLLFDWDFGQAEKSYLQAIKLNPNDAEAHRYYSFYLVIVGCNEEAIREAEIALGIDPLAHHLILQVSHVLYYTRRYDEAIAMYRKCLDAEPKFLLAQIGLARSYTEKGMFKEAFLVMDSIDSSLQENPRVITARGYISAKAGDTKNAGQAIEKLLELSLKIYVSSFDMAIVCAGLKDIEQALYWLEKAFAERSFLMPFLKPDPYFDSLRKDSRFDDMLKRIGF